MGGGEEISMLNIICIFMFMLVVYIIGQQRINLGIYWFLNGECVLCVYVIEYFLVMIRNVILLYVVIWMKMIDFILSEMLGLKDKQYMFLFLGGFEGSCF